MEQPIKLTIPQTDFFRKVFKGAIFLVIRKMFVF